MMPLATADQDRWLSEKQNPAYRLALIFKEENTLCKEGVFYLPLFLWEKTEYNKEKIYIRRAIMNEFVKKMLDYNRVFVEHELYEKYATTKYPDRKIAILACMDTRMTELLPAALGLKNGDVKLIKNAGGRVMHPYGSVIFSLMVAVYELGVETIIVVGHDDCGGRLLDAQEMIRKMKARGVRQEDIDHVDANVKNVEQWLTGFGDIYDSVQSTVDAITEHPLLPKDIEVLGFIMDPHTGAIRAI